jgi:tetratricopeptide (TPR) repeat protein
MDNTEDILKKAHSLFTAKEYDKALFLYSQVIATDPKSIEYQLYCIICDIAMEDEEKAQSLFDYFIVSKDVDFDEAVKYVEDIIDAHDGNNDKMMNLLKDISNTSV